MLKLQPSAASRWMNCTASPRFELKFPPRIIGKAAKEGTKAHAIAETLIKNEIPEEFPVSMGSAIKTYLQVIDEEKKKDKDGVLLIESTVDTTKNLFNEELSIKGRIDALIVRPNLISIIDFKYGHTPVNVFENWQLLVYAYLLAFSRKHDAHKKDFKFIIVQPRVYTTEKPIQTWEISNKNITHPYFMKINGVFKYILSHETEFKSGEWCKYCAGVTECPLLNNKIENFPAIPQQTKNPEEIGEILNELVELQRILKYQYDACEAMAVQSINQGNKIPGWQLRPGRDVIRWNRPAEEIGKVGDKIGLELRKPLECITPLQAKNKGLDEQTFLDYSEIIQGKVKLRQTDINYTKELFEGRKSG